MLTATLAPVLLFTILGIFNLIFFSFLLQSLSFSACKECILTLKFGDLLQINQASQIVSDFMDVCVLVWWKLWDSNPYENEQMFSLFMSCIMIAIFSKSMDLMIDWILKLASKVGGGLDGIDLQSFASATYGAFMEPARTLRSTAQNVRSSRRR